MCGLALGCFPSMATSMAASKKTTKKPKVTIPIRGQAAGRPVVFGDAARGSDCPDNSGAGVDFYEGTIGDVNGRSPRTYDSR